MITLYIWVEFRNEKDVKEVSQLEPTTTFKKLEVSIATLHTHTLLEKENLDLANSTKPTLLPTLPATKPLAEKPDFTNKPQLLDLSLSVLMPQPGLDTKEES